MTGLPQPAPACCVCLRCLPQLVHADILCPMPPIDRHLTLRHTAAYAHCIRRASQGSATELLFAVVARAAGGSDGGTGRSGSDAAAGAAEAECLAEVLRAYLAATQLAGQLRGLAAISEGLALVDLPGFRPALQRALAALEERQAQEAGPAAPLPTAAQLEWACNYLAAHSAVQIEEQQQLQQRGTTVQLAAQLGIVGPAPEQLCRQQLHVVCSVERRAVEALLQLEPDNPKGLMLAAAAYSHSEADAELAAHLFLRSHGLGRAQRSDWFVAEGAARALSVVADCGASVGRATLEAVVAAYADVAPARKRCRQLLPHPWVASMELFASAEQQLLGYIQQQLGEEQEPDR